MKHFLIVKLFLLLCLFAFSTPLQAAECNVREYGAKGDKTVNDRAAIQSAIDACAKEGGGTVLFPNGEYLSGSLRLRSNITLHLSEGATLFATKQQEDYEKLDPRIYGTSASSHLNVSHLIIADKVENIAITGRGTIHGQATEDFGTRWGAFDSPDAFRRGMILITESKNIAIRDVQILYSDYWTVHLKFCDTIFIDGITIFNNVRHLNSDGIDPNSCTNVHISNCRVTTGDDAIDLKTSEGKPTENVVINNCTVESTATGLKFGTASSGDFRNVHFSNITVKAPTGIGFYMKDGGTAENVTFSNITINTPRATYRQVFPIFMDIERRNKDSALSAIRDVSYRDIKINSGSSIVVQGMAERKIENLTFDNISFRVTEPDDFSARARIAGGPKTTADEREIIYTRLPTYFAVAHVNGLNLANIRVLSNAEYERKFPRSALAVHETNDVSIRNLRRATGSNVENTSAMSFHNSRNVMITDCMADNSQASFVYLSGKDTADIALLNNDLRRAAKPFQLAPEVKIKPLFR